MTLPDQLLLSDLLRRRVRCDQGLDHGAGSTAWMHPPVHRLLGWVSKPSAFGSRREVWRLNQIRGLAELEVMVKGEPAETEQDTLERLPTLIEATLLGRGDLPLGTLVDAAVDLRSGAIRHYLVSRSDPRLPGSSRWRLSPERIVDQRPGEVRTALEGLDDLPLARASVRQDFMRRSRRWRDQVKDLGDRFEQRVEGWLEEPPWDDRGVEPESRSAGSWNDMPRQAGSSTEEPWLSEEAGFDQEARPSPQGWADEQAPPADRGSRRGSQGRHHSTSGSDDDPWV